LINLFIKKIFSDSIIYGLGNILNRFLLFLLLPLYTYYFNPVQFGVFSLVYAFWFFAAVFYLYGMETSFQKHFIESLKLNNSSIIFSSAIFQIAGTSLIFSIIIYSLSPFISKLLTGTEANSSLVNLIALLLFIDSLSRFPMIAINAEQKAKVYSFINISSVVVNVIFNVLFIVVFKWGIESIFYAFIISYSYQLILSFFFCREYFVFKIDTSEIKKLIKFAHSFLYYGIFLISLDLIDRYFIGYFHGEASVGIYSACYRIGLVMNLLISGFRTAWIPFFMDLKEEKYNKLIFSKIFSYFVYGAMILFLTVSLFAGDIVHLKIGNISFLAKDYWSGIIIIPYILMAYFFFGLYTNLNIASYFENKISYLIISSGSGFVSNIILNIILIPPYNITGAAISTMLSYLIMFVVLYYLSQKVYHIPYDIFRSVFIVIFALLLYFVSVFIPDWTNMNTISVYFIKVFSVFLLIFVIMRYFLRISPKINV
jgi:O-antigen/teichoic acid export membrane protein